MTIKLKSKLPINAIKLIKKFNIFFKLYCNTACELINGMKLSSSAFWRVSAMPVFRLKYNISYSANFVHMFAKCFFCIWRFVQSPRNKILFIYKSSSVDKLILLFSLTIISSFLFLLSTVGSMKINSILILWIERTTNNTSALYLNVIHRKRFLTLKNKTLMILSSYPHYFSVRSIHKRRKEVII